MNILCENPKIILNRGKDVNKVFRSHNWEYVLRGNVVSFVPSSKKARIKSDELDECYYLNKITGEMVPMYLEVPCQKCVLCRDKKAKEWSARCACEAQYSDYIPWWITLTYNDIYKPDNGLCKRDIQLFFKNLRERLCRYLNCDVRIRYVSVGEYGGNFHRPHYHAEIFGIPVKSARKVLTIIENAWAYRISYQKFRHILDKYGDYSKELTFIRENKLGKPMYYLRKGFAYVKPAHNGTPYYLAKYMFKPEDNTPKGCVPNFYIASRQNGIGYDYIIENMDYHRRNPNVTQIVFRNKFTGKLYHFGIPRYFKDYWFPTPSKIIPQDVKKEYDEFQYNVSLLNGIRNVLSQNGYDIFDDVTNLIFDINNKYRFWKPIFYTAFDVNFFLDSNFKSRFTHFEPDNLTMTLELFGRKKVITGLPRKVHDIEYMTFCKRAFVQVYQWVIDSYDYLMKFDLHDDIIHDLFKLRDIHKGAIMTMMRSLPQKTVNEAKYDILKSYYKLKDNELKYGY